MAISIRHKVTTAELNVTGTPRPEHLYEWWSMLKGDPEDIALAYADGFPNTLDAFLERVWSGIYREFSLIMHGDDVAGAFWLHDTLAKDGVTIGGWLGGYMMPAYRASAAATAQSLLQHLAARGIRHLFSAVHEGNRPSRFYTRKLLKLNQVGKYPNFTRFGGELVNVVIYSQHQADADLAWAEASKRHRQNLRLAS